MMHQVLVTDDAEQDLQDIWDYIGQNSPTAADRFSKYLLAEIAKLGMHPGMGRPRDEFAKGMRSWPCENYLVYYRVVNDVVQILRIIHGARSQRRTLGDLVDR